MGNAQGDRARIVSRPQTSFGEGASGRRPRRAPSTVREEEEQKGNKVINARYVLDGRPGEDVSVEPPS